MTSTQTPAVRLTDLTKTFAAGGAAVRAVRGIDLTIGRGEVVAVLGPNGAGKTTTLDLVLGLTTPTSGSVDVLGGPPRVLGVALAGAPISVVARGVHLSEGTVRNYLSSAMAKTGTSTRAEAAIHARDRGWL
jgi:ABC-2 type transport system ATP-binding protein